METEEKHKHDNEISLPEVVIGKLKNPFVFVAAVVVAAFVFLLLAQANLAERQARQGQGSIISGPGSNFYIARVLEVTDEGSLDIGGIKYPYQEIKVEISSEERRGEVVEIRNEIQYGSEAVQTVREGEDIVVTSSGDEDNELFYVSDKYRFPSVMLLFVVFFGLTILFAGWKGVTSLLGLAFTIYVLVGYVVPSIVIGDDPLTISLIGAFIIAAVSMYLAHGANLRITIALGGTLISIGLAALLSVIFVNVAQLFGTGSEEAILLTISTEHSINLKGLLLGGIIFGALGVLDDVTTAQAAAVEELKRANHKLGMRELYKRGISIGREHIVSLVNTLVLAYIGSSFPLLLLFSLNQGVPLWLTFNSEFIMEEVIRTLVGSSALVFAVPITTLMAAWFFARHTPTGEPDPHAHKH